MTINRVTATPPPPFTTEEIECICEAIHKKDPWYYHYFMFALQTGMRRSEMLALTWHDVDLWKHREVIVPDPKRPRQRNRDGRRIPIDQALLSLLLDLRSPSRWVFQKTGKRMLGGTVTTFFGVLGRQLNIPMSSERMRWTYAHNLYKKIQPHHREDWKKIQKLLGHKELWTTKNYYQRNLEENAVL